MKNTIQKFTRKIINKMKSYNIEEIEPIDYAKIVGHFIGDAAGSIPMAGGFITAVKNVAFNIASKKQADRIFKLLNELSIKVSKVEQCFKKLIRNDTFLVRFYKILYFQKDNTDDKLFNLYLGYLRIYLEGNIEIGEDDFIFSIITTLNGYSVRFLDEFHRNHSYNWVNLKKFYSIQNRKNGIDYDDINYKDHRCFLEFISLGIFEERHGLHSDKNSSGYIEDVLISKLGSRIIQVLRNGE